MNMNLKRCLFVVALALVGSWCQTSLAVITGQYLFEGNANDSSGFNRHGTITGGTSTSGLYLGSTSALLQVSGNSVELPPNSDFIRNAPGATLLAWVRPDDLSGTAARNVVVVNNADPAGAGGLGNARALIEWDPAAGFRAIGRQADTGGSTIASGGTAAIGQLYFLSAVFDYLNGDIFLYINGAQVGSNTGAPWTANSADSANLAARIGSHIGGAQQFWVGAIDGVRIYNEPLSAANILGIYNAENPIIPGDTDGDGNVEPEDLTPIRNNWRKIGQSRLQGNLSGDAGGLVDFADFRQWKTAILSGGGSLSGTDLSFVSVPEPTALGLALFGFMGTMLRRRSR
jgi:Concanavalin A-like lectin/glucanases superfamily